MYVYYFTYRHKQRRWDLWVPRQCRSKDWQTGSEVWEGGYAGKYRQCRGHSTGVSIAKKYVLIKQLKISFRSPKGKISAMTVDRFLSFKVLGLHLCPEVICGLVWQLYGLDSLKWHWWGRPVPLGPWLLNKIIKPQV